jgi:FkbM family methyltransferase
MEELLENGPGADRTAQAGDAAEELFIPHVGWLEFPGNDYVATALKEGWYDFEEQAFLWRYLREQDTFIDAGAHVGLYSRLATASAPGARVFAIEPSPRNLRFLKSNLAAVDPPVQIVAAALADASGSGTFYEADSVHAAYSSLTQPMPEAHKFTVSLETLDGLCAQHAIEDVACLKLDVEGAELAALAGSSGVLARRGIRLLLIEFCELNLRRFNTSSEELFHRCRQAGYELYKWDGGANLLPQKFEGPIWYDNLLATPDPAWVSARLQGAAHGQLRVSREIMSRGAASAALHSGELHTAREAAERRLAQRQDDLAAFEKRVIEAETRAERALAEADQAYKRLAQAQWREQQSADQVEEANRRAREAWDLVAKLQNQHNEARAQCDTALAQADEAYRRLAQAQWREQKSADQIEEANGRAREAWDMVAALQNQHNENRARYDAALAQADEAYKRVGEAHWLRDDALKERDLLRAENAGLTMTIEELKLGRGERIGH